jgi:hypothetical protein
MARTFETLSLSLPPDAVRRLEELGAGRNTTATRVAAHIVLRELDFLPDQTTAEREAFRRKFAAEALLTMLENGGNRDDKVRAAIAYADALVAALDQPRGEP